MKTYSAKPSDITRQWYLVDASEIPLGRMATKIASLLSGKYKPIFTQHIDCGDNVVVINADHLVVTGKKLADKKYYRHSGYPGNLREASLEEKIAKDACEVVRLAVRGMRLARLKIHRGLNHDHEAQKPQKVSLK